MAWTVPVDFHDGDPLTAAQLNTFVRDNFLETGPGKATMESRMLVTENVNHIVERQWARAYEDSQITVNNTFPHSEDDEGKLYGPVVTVEHGRQMLILFDTLIQVQSGGGNGIYAPMIAGNAPESSNYALRTAREGIFRTGAFYWATGLEPGTSQVTMCYGASNQTTTVNYRYRRMTVIPF